MTRGRSDGHRGGRGREEARSPSRHSASSSHASSEGSSEPPPPQRSSRRRASSGKGSQNRRTEVVKARNATRRDHSNDDESMSPAKDSASTAAPRSRDASPTKQGGYWPSVRGLLEATSQWLLEGSPSGGQSPTSSVERKSRKVTAERTERAERAERSERTERVPPPAPAAASAPAAATQSSARSSKEPKYRHRRTADEVWRCKKGKRSDIKPGEWARFGYARNEEVLRRPIVYDEQTVPIRRVKRQDITPEWFYEHCALKAEPIIIEDALGHWPALRRWSIDALEERFRQVPFKVAKDDKGKKLRMKFKYYADYIRQQQDDSPLYLFETNMDDNAYIRPLMDDYEVPDLFPHDWFNMVNHDSRPPYRWFCIGPKRSGTTVHIDPLGTAAWNAVTHGCKHWVLFEPAESRRVVKGKDLVQKGEDDEAIMYFDFILPRIKKAYPNLRVYEGLQNPGEIIFVPGDWWHGVLNREDCVAVTQNYCGPDNFNLVWRRTRKEREKVASLWLRNMRRYFPELHARALALNKGDNFRMRHEREPGEKLSDCSSSSSESSSDSSTDEAEDLDFGGLQDAPSLTPRFGADAFRLQGSYPAFRGAGDACIPNGMARTRSARHSGELRPGAEHARQRESKRRRRGDEDQEDA